MTPAIIDHLKRPTSLITWPVRILLLITIAAALIPLSPSMPGAGLDSSWVYGLGEAVANKLVFGKDLVFTLGPYASIYTASYHPATYHFVLFGATWMALGFSLLFGYLLSNRPLFLSFLAIFFLACNGGAPDATLLLYPLLLSVFIYRLTLPVDDSERIDINKGFVGYLIIFLLFGVLGLIPLIKGSLLILAVVIGGLCVSRLFLTGQRQLTIVAIAGGVASLLLFWVIAGQPLHGLPYYFANMLPIASGYTEAMSSKGKSAHIATYLVPWVLLVGTILMARSLTWRGRLYLLAAFGSFLFLAFKEGFVRHDAHATIAGSAIFLAGVSLCMAIKGHWRWPTLALCVIAWFAICNTYSPISLSGAAAHALNRFDRFGTGLWTSIRQTRDLQASFESARNRLRQQRAIPSLHGSSDIYSFDQSYLLASNNHWSPRPVFQSYSVYTPKLAEMNRLHLLGPASPDNIVFSVQPLDQRFPASEDGPSWPVLMGLYKPVRYLDGFIYLERRQGNPQLPLIRPLLEQDHAMGATIAVPESTFPIFVRVHMKRTFVGRVAGILFKPEQIRITVKLLDGSIKDYRLVPGMGEAGFVLSPLVENTSDFLLSYGSWEFLANKRVTSISITPQSKHSLSWAGYTLTFSEIVGSARTDIDSMISAVKPFEIADKQEPLKEADCFGSIDHINGLSPTVQTTAYSSILSIGGWVAENRDTLGSEDFVATMTTETGTAYAAQLTRHQRPDVATYFKSPVLEKSGYQTLIDANGFDGVIEIGLARKVSQVWTACSQYHYPVNLKIVRNASPR